MRFSKILKYTVCLFFVLFIVFLSIKLKDTDSRHTSLKISTKATNCDVTFWVTGDAMMHLSQYHAVQNPTTHIPVFDSCYTEIRSIVKKADVRIINLETTLAAPPYSGYPRFCAPREYADALVRAGFNLFVMANNHACDRGRKGIIGNIHYADSAQIGHTGIFRNKAERDSLYPLILKIKGWKIALLNATYGTNGIGVPSPCIVNRIDTIEIKKDIARAKAQNVDAILMAIHWGKEYQHLPNSRQKAIAAFLLREGVDVIIGSHPHVVQPVELIHTPDSLANARLVIWSLGNFISNQKDTLTDAGLMVGFTLKRNHSTYHPDVEDIKFLPFYRHKTTNKPGYLLLPGSCTKKRLRNLISSREERKKFKDVMNNTRKKMGKDKRISEYQDN